MDKNYQRDLSLPVQFVKGIGAKRAAVLAKRSIKTVRDLLYYFPYAYIDLSKVEKISELRREIDSGALVTAIGTVRTFDLLGRPPKQRFVVVLEDETGTVQLVFFAMVNFFKKAFRVGETIAVSGRVSGFNNRPQFVHPSIDRLWEEDDGDLRGFLHTGGIVPKYGSSEELKDVNLHVKGLRRIMKATMDEFLPLVEESLPESLLRQHCFVPLQEALRSIHFPENQDCLSAARRRLKFDELFAMQMLLGLRQNKIKVETPGIQFDVVSKLARQLVDALPFRLTKAQVRVINEITGDLKSGKPMNRLLQGDVGSGKTIVALVAMLIAVENGWQVAFMAPTEILAEQHFRTLADFLGELPVNVRLLIGAQRSKLRMDILEDVGRGTAQIVVGTHALIEGDVRFNRLGLVVIDEQHRFGVAQRMALREKGGSRANDTPYPHVLVMTATPIPRTLSLTVFGDLDVSIIDELPANRKAVKTALRLESELPKVHEFIRQTVKAGQQVYIVYPLVEESEKLDLKAAVESYEHLRSEVFPDLRVGLIHGRMAPAEKDEVMAAFKKGKIDVLVATTVIEVGIDVPNATVMVIEHSERFGLAQLHQLRGRVGRGGGQSYCILVAPDWMRRRISSSFRAPSLDGEQEERRRAERRLATMVETTDGFKIAEIDLELRGPGDFFGTRQSGLPLLQIANLLTDGDLLTLARREALSLIERDPHLRMPEHQSLRIFFAERIGNTLALVQSG